MALNFDPVLLEIAIDKASITALRSTLKSICRESDVCGSHAAKHLLVSPGHGSKNKKRRLDIEDDRIEIVSVKKQNTGPAT